MAEGKWRKILTLVWRKRDFDPERVDSSENLRRCLNCWDLTFLGVGSTLGIGVYVLVGSVALKTAGPSIVLSFLIAAVTSLFAGMCYAELGSRVPLAGSAFIYTYVTVGELVAFIVGWNNILEFTCATASVASGLSSYVDVITNHSMSGWFQLTMPIPEHFGISTYFDLFSFVIVLCIGTVLSFGVRESSTINNLLSAVNVIVIIFVVIAGAFKANPDNWSISPEQVPPGYGEGGFFPYGLRGMLKGAAICFYGFVGFDVINASGEEVNNPKKTIPAAILSCLLIVFTAYASISIILTMMVPYYELLAVASVATAFGQVGWKWAQWIVTVGAIFGISTSLFGALFPLPRLLYSMAKDGLFVHWFARVSTARKSPIIATLASAVVISLLAGFLNLEQLILMMCVGTLCSYTIVATCVVLLRYWSENESDVSSSVMKLVIGRGNRTATKTTSRIINIAMFLYICTCLTIALVAVNAPKPLIPAIILHVLALIIIIVMALQPRCPEDISFRTPLVPLIPCISIYTNLHLMVLINFHTWIRVILWILIGIPIYLICLWCYKQNSRKEPADKNNKLHASKNGKSPTVQIVVESPTPPLTLSRTDEHTGEYDDAKEIHQELRDKAIDTKKVQVITVQQIQIENNEEKEAKIIDLLDQVLQAEEDTYGEDISIKDNKEEDNKTSETSIPHRKSLSELSDAGSDASLGNQGLSKYDVIAQVHREDLPKVDEDEDERLDNNEDIHNFEDEEITAFNDSETNSRTDESGYSDTIDRHALSESLDDPQLSTIPVPPPPPPLDEEYFKPKNNYKKFYTVNYRHSEPELEENDEVIEPRVSIQSSNSQSDGNIRFGSDRQIKFMSKLNNIFQKSRVPDEEEEEPRRRSHSTGNFPDTELSVKRDRPSMFEDLKKELLSREAAQNLRPVDTEDKTPESDSSEVEEVDEDISLSRQDLKHKLEGIFALGGPQLMKPRLMKTNPSTPDESNLTDNNSSSESIAKMPKVDKNDTLGRQKAKFGEVLNSIRLSMNPDDQV